jgi:hypothetical protein
MNICIHFTVSNNSWHYFRYASESHLKLANHPERVRFWIYSLDPECTERAEREPLVVGVTRFHGMRGSNAHAAALQAAFKNFKPGGRDVRDAEINIIADSDAAVLMHGWDTVVEDEIIKKNVGVFGITVYEDIGGFSSGVSKYQTYKSLPCLTWTAFTPHHDFRDMVDLSPDKSNPMEIKTPEQSALYNLPVGYFLVKDAAWRTPEYYQKHHLKLHVLKPHKPSKTAVVLKGLSDYHDEFHYDGKPFLIHQRGSMNHRFRIDPLSKGFYDAADRYLMYPTWSVKAPFRLSNLLRRPLYDLLLRLQNAIKRRLPRAPA